MLRASFSEVIKTSKNGDCTASLGNLLQCLTVFMGESFPRTSRTPVQSHTSSVSPSWLMLCEICREWQRAQPEALTVDGNLPSASPGLAFIAKLSCSKPRTARPLGW